MADIADFFDEVKSYGRGRVFIDLAHPAKSRDPHRRGDSLMREVAATLERLEHPVHYKGETLLDSGTRHHLFEVYNDNAVPSKALTRVHVEESAADHDMTTAFRVTLMSSPLDDAAANTWYFDQYRQVIEVMLSLAPAAHNGSNGPLTWADLRAVYAPEGLRDPITPWTDDARPGPNAYTGPANEGLPVAKAVPNFFQDTSPSDQARLLSDAIFNHMRGSDISCVDDLVEGAIGVMQRFGVSVGYDSSFGDVPKGRILFESPNIEMWFSAAVVIDTRRTDDGQARYRMTLGPEYTTVRYFDNVDDLMHAFASIAWFIHAQPDRHPFPWNWVENAVGTRWPCKPITPWVSADLPDVGF